MIPKSFSATALGTADLCPSRYKAEVIDRGAQFQGTAAGVGIVAHGTLENFLRAVYIRKDGKWDWDFFVGLFYKEFDKQFGPDRSIPEYMDALQILRDWYYRPDIEEDLECTQILSLESKHSFPIRTSVGEIPVNYIMDRVERIAVGEYKVVDYKTNRVALTAEQVSKKLQAKLYALAIQITHKDATKIWVQFDYLRHGIAPMVAFTKEDNTETWRMLKRKTQLIIDTSDEDAEKLERINPECGFCVKKTTCKALASNINAGGVLGMGDEQLAKRYLAITDQTKALNYAKADIENQLLQALLSSDLTTLELDDVVIRLVAKSRRVLDHSRIPMVLGQELASAMSPFTLDKIDNLLKGNTIGSAQKELLKTLITSERGEAKIQVTAK